MADLFALDASVYIAAFREARALAELKAFRQRVGLRLVMSGIVAMELAAGAVTDEHDAAVRSLVEPYAARGAVLPVSAESCRQAGRVLAALARHERMALDSARRSLTNDVLIATSCCEAGAMLVTNNTRDFAAIQRHLRGFRFAARWPLSTMR